MLRLILLVILSLSLTSEALAFRRGGRRHRRRGTMVRVTNMNYDQFRANPRMQRRAYRNYGVVVTDQASYAQLQAKVQQRRQRRVTRWTAINNATSLASIQDPNLRARLTMRFAGNDALFLAWKARSQNRRNRRMARHTGVATTITGTSPFLPYAQPTVPTTTNISPFAVAQ